MSLLKDKIIFLTGGSEGIGYECAKAYSAEGAKVVIAALDETRINEVIDESTIPNPVTNYGKSKLLSETRLRQLTIPLVILRPTAIYGPREKGIFLMFKSIKKGLELYIGKNEQRLSFIYVKDMADATINALTNANNSIYNLSDGNSYTRYDLANYLKLLMKKKTLKFHLSIGLTRMLAKTLEKADGIFDKTPVLNEDKLNELTGKNWVCSIEKAKKENARHMAK